MRFLLFMAAANMGHAQILSLATNGDGSQVWFHTAQPRKGTGEPVQGRIFRLGPEGLALVASLDRQNPELPTLPVSAPLPPDTYFTNHFDLYAPQVSANGAVMAFHGRSICYRCTQAGASATRKYILERSGQTLYSAAGEADLSRNGRYLATYHYRPGWVDVRIMDLDNGAQSVPGVQTQNWPARAGRVVSDTGVTVIVDSFRGGLHLLSNESRNFILGLDSQAYPLREAVIDAAGESVAYLTDNAAGHPSIRLYHVKQNRHSLWATCASACRSLHISSDGQRATVLQDNQIFLTSSENTMHQLTREPFGVLRYTVSDDGRVVWYVNGTGELIRFVIATGQTQVRLPRTPGLSPELEPLTSGSLHWIRGEGFTMQPSIATALPLPTQLAGVRVTVDNIASPIHSISPTSIAVQVPWETRARSQAEVVVHTESPSSFSPALASSRHIELVAPRFLELQPGVFAAHESWERLVTTDHPATQGELIHLYGTGFGPVSHTAATGAAATGPAPVSSSVACSVPLVYAGLAPGLVGVYQISVRLPTAGTGASAILIDCRVGDEHSGARAVVPFAP